MNKNSIISHYLLSIDQMGAYINDLTDSEIKKIFEPMNCIGWLLGHCSYYNFSIANKISNKDIPEEAKKYMNGMPHSTPELDEILNLWKSSTDIVKDSLINLDEQELKNKFTSEFKHGSEAEKINLGTDISRLIFHLWNHLGEIASVRQLLGKKPGNPGYGKWDWRY